MGRGGEFDLRTPFEIQYVCYYKYQIKHMNTAKTAFIRARIEPKLKKEAEVIFKKIGVNTTDAITIFLRQVTFYQGLPFFVNIPNKETISALGEDLSSVKSYTNVDNMFTEILNEKE